MIKLRLGPMHEEAFVRLFRPWSPLWKIVLVVPYAWPYRDGEDIMIDAGIWYVLGRRRAINKARRIVAKHRARMAALPRPNIVIR